MTPLEILLREQIARSGPIPFREFMQQALYHPEYGYYSRPRDPFGKAGDFYTAEQLQPVFGILIATIISNLWRELGSPADFTVIELGAGRAEMAEAFSEWKYIPLDSSTSATSLNPSTCFPHAVVFSNEFFDALPVDAAIVIDGTPRDLRVGFDGRRFAWVTGDRVSPRIEEYWRKYCPQSSMFEANLAALDWMERIAGALGSGFHLTIDYGYETREHMRFPQGTLMSYRRHRADEDVLLSPGERDITSHVPFSALIDAGSARGLQLVRLETLAQTLLRAGEGDQFAAALGTDRLPEAAQLSRRLQLKSLLFGMGETFRTLLQRKARK